MSITDSLTKIRMSALKETRNKLGHSSVWTADEKIMYKDEGNTNVKVYFDWYSGKQKLCYRKIEIVFDFDGIIFFICFVLSFWKRGSPRWPYFILYLYPCFRSITFFIKNNKTSKVSIFLTIFFYTQLKQMIQLFLVKTRNQ